MSSITHSTHAELRFKLDGSTLVQKKAETTVSAITLISQTLTDSETISGCATPQSTNKHLAGGESPKSKKVLYSSTSSPNLSSLSKSSHPIPSPYLSGNSSSCNSVSTSPTEEAFKRRIPETAQLISSSRPGNALHHTGAIPEFSLLSLSPKLRLVVFSPLSSVQEIKKALQNYAICLSGTLASNVITCESGVSRFRPLEGSTPKSGKIGEVEEVHEQKIEVTISRENLEKAIVAVKFVHPYETPGIEYHDEFTADAIPEFIDAQTSIGNSPSSSSKLSTSLPSSTYASTSPSLLSLSDAKTVSPCSTACKSAHSASLKGFSALGASALLFNSSPSTVSSSLLSLSRKYKIIVCSPLAYISMVQKVMEDAGAGTIGKYAGCMFTSDTEQINDRSLKVAKKVAKISETNLVKERKIETVVSANLIVKVIKAVKMVLPFEKPGIECFEVYSHG